MSLVTPEQYKLAQDPRVQPIFDLNNADGLPDINAREALANKLYAQGFNPDRAIWIEGLPAGAVMWIRQTYGVKWLGNAFENQNYDPNVPMPARAIPTKTDAADYPAFTPPPPPAPTPNGDVGPKNGDFYSASFSLLGPNGWKYKEGEDVTHDGIQLFFHLAGGFGGVTPMWLTAAQYQKWQTTGTI